MHTPTKRIATIGISSDSSHIFLGSSLQYGFDDWIKIRTKKVGLCGGDYNNRISLPLHKYSMVIGHEAIVEALEDSGRIRQHRLYVPIPGRRFCIQHRHKKECGHCSPYINRGTSRWDGFASVSGLEDPEYLIEVPDTLITYGFLTEPLSVCEHLLHEVLKLPSSTKKIAIVGLGTLGLLISSILADLKVAVSGFDVNSGPNKGTFEMLGADTSYIHNTENNLHIYKNDFPIVIETAGSSSSLQNAVDIASIGGCVFVLGIPTTCNTLNFHDAIVRKELTIKGVVSAHRKYFLNAITRLMSWTSHKPDFIKSLVTHELYYTRINEALSLSPKDRIKIAIVFDE